MATLTDLHPSRRGVLGDELLVLVVLVVVEVVRVDGLDRVVTGGGHTAAGHVPHLVRRSLLHINILWG